MSELAETGAMGGPARFLWHHKKISYYHYSNSNQKSYEQREDDRSMSDRKNVQNIPEKLDPTVSHKEYDEGRQEKNIESQNLAEPRHSYHSSSTYETSLYSTAGESPEPPDLDEPPPLSMREKVLNKALNVPHLVIGDTEELFINTADHIYLPSVKTFTWHSQNDEYNEEDDPTADYDDYTRKRVINMKRQTAYKILRSAPNLEEIYDFHFDTDVDLVVRAGKVGTVHHLTLHDTDNVDSILDFIKGGPRVKVLQLIHTMAEDDEEVNYYPDGRRRLTHAVKKLLEATADTLRVLDLTQFCTTCHDLGIPPLPNLYQLTLGSAAVLGHPEEGKPYPSRVLPRHVLLDESFPNLKVLDCSRLQGEENGNWDLYFPVAHNFQRHLDSVEVVVMDDKWTHFWMEKLESVCPNFVKLVIHSDGHGNNLDFMCVKVFRYWQHLEALEIRVEDFPIHSFSLDSAFTGLREDTCRLLRVFGPAGHDCMVGKTELENSYIRPSIANLHGLKTLDMIFDHHCLGRLSHQDDLNLPITFVSGRYGFSHIPGLQVNVYFDHKCPWGKAIIKKFEPLRLYVSLKHKVDSHCALIHHHQREGKAVRFNR